jgi:hypothetical protein
MRPTDSLIGTRRVSEEPAEPEFQSFPRALVGLKMTDFHLPLG